MDAISYLYSGGPTSILGQNVSRYLMDLLVPVRKCCESSLNITRPLTSGSYPIPTHTLIWHCTVCVFEKASLNTLSNKNSDCLSVHVNTCVGTSGHEFGIHRPIRDPDAENF